MARAQTRFPLVLIALVAPVACEGSDPVAVVDGPRATCALDADCDDGLACTVDRCALDEEGRGFCAWSPGPEQCLLGGACVPAGAPRPDVPCQVCDPSKPFTWSAVADGGACDDGSLCTEGDACAGGVCGGTPVLCEDDNACTRDACDPAVGCRFISLDGLTCDDGVRCTLDDRCLQAACAGVPDACDDGDPCTVDACNEVEGCTHTVTPRLACDDGDACTSNDFCAEGQCRAGGPTDCDDGNTCTLDTCDPIAGCVHLPTLAPCCIGAVSVCDDGDPCTDDACDPATTDGCVHTPNSAPCDDWDPCTIGDRCGDGVCLGTPGSACDDGNPCTADTCNPSLPDLCLHESLAGPCDDGLACTTGDACQDGACAGDASACVCVPDLSVDGAKLTSIQIGMGGTPGEGVDVDADPSTCAPNGCSAGVDNTLSIIAGLANDQLAAAVASGQVTLVVEFGSLDASPIEVAVYQARRANAACNLQTQTCDWLVDESFLDPSTCDPIARLFAQRDGNHLSGGGPGTRLPFVIPFEGAELEVVLANLRIEVDVTTQGGQVTGFAGLLGGAVPKQTLLDGLAGLPDDALPIDKDAAIGLVDSLVDNDIDSDGDGVLDAASIGIKLIAIDARLIGVAQ